MAITWTGAADLLQVTKKLLCAGVPPIPIRNDFSDVQRYMLQKSMPRALASLRTQHGVPPSDVVQFVVDLMHYIENGKNAYDDSVLRATYVDAIAATLPATGRQASASPPTLSACSADVRLVLEEIVLRLNLEKMLPSTRHAVTVSCLRALRQAQRHGHIPDGVDIFMPYATYGNADELRLCAFDIIIDYLIC